MRTNQVLAPVDSRDPVSRSGLSTLVNGIEILETIAELRGDVTAKRIARDFSLSMGRTYHVLRTLELAGYISKRRGGGFNISPRGVRLGRLLQENTQVDRGLQSLLAALQRRTGETCYVVGWREDDLVIQDLLLGTQSVVVRGLDVGYRGNMHARASCKAVLAFMPEQRVVELLGPEPFRPITSATTTSYDQVLTQLARIRMRGYAAEFGEFNPDICCIGAPYFDADGMPQGSFAVSVPAARFSGARQTVEPAVREAALRATRYLESRSARPPV